MDWLKSEHDGTIRSSIPIPGVLDRMDDESRATDPPSIATDPGVSGSQPRVGLVLGLIAYEVGMGALLFGSAKRWDLPWFWSFLAVHSSLMVIMLVLLDPGLVRERLRPGPGGRDRWLRRLMIPLYIVQLFLAGRDVGRKGWTGPLPIWVHSVGLLVFALGMGIAVWAMVVNQFFSPMVRIQDERGHHVISAGPYGYVRHPGYTGILIATFATGFALRSPWAVLPAFGITILVLRRTWLEDEFLLQGLPGYTEYAARVRFRLWPGVW